MFKKCTLDTLSEKRHVYHLHLDFKTEQDTLITTSRQEYQLKVNIHVLKVNVNRISTHHNLYTTLTKHVHDICITYTLHVHDICII